VPRDNGASAGGARRNAQLPKRVPGQTDVGHDPRFRLVAGRGVAQIPVRSRVTLAVSVGIARSTVEARERIKQHMPSRHRDCQTCEETAPCRPFTRALTILDRHDSGMARRVRAVLQVLALPAPPSTTQIAWSSRSSPR
jgi:hypothetical protein